MTKVYVSTREAGYMGMLGLRVVVVTRDDEAGWGWELSLKAETARELAAKLLDNAEEIDPAGNR